MTEYSYLDSEGAIAAIETPILRGAFNLMEDSVLDPERSGAWVVPFENEAAADEVCVQAVCEGVCVMCVRTNGKLVEKGVREIRLYANADDDVAQWRIVRFLLESDLLPQTNDDCLLDLAFEFDSPVSPCDDVHLSDFVDLTPATFED